MRPSTICCMRIAAVVASMERKVKVFQLPQSSSAVVAVFVLLLGSTVKVCFCCVLVLLTQNGSHTGTPFPRVQNAAGVHLVMSIRDSTFDMGHRRCSQRIHNNLLIIFFLCLSSWVYVCFSTCGGIVKRTLKLMQSTSQWCVRCGL